MNSGGSFSFASDWSFLRAAAPDFEQYLLSGQHDWPLNLQLANRATGTIIRMTPGLVSLSLIRLNAKPDLTPDESQQLQDINNQIAEVTKHWLSHWRLKTARDLENRMEYWQMYLTELGNPAHRIPAAYPFQVRNRVILSLLQEQMQTEVPLVYARLAGLDTLVLDRTQPGEFLWEPEIQAKFDRRIYWFLYRVAIRR